MLYYLIDDIDKLQSWTQVVKDILDHLHSHYHSNKLLHGEIGPDSILYDGNRFSLVPSKERRPAYSLPHRHPNLIHWCPPERMFDPVYDFYALFTSIIFVVLGEYFWSDKDKNVVASEVKDKYLLFVYKKLPRLHNRELVASLTDLHLRISGVVLSEDEERVIHNSQKYRTRKLPDHDTEAGTKRRPNVV